LKKKNTASTSVQYAYRVAKGNTVLVIRVFRIYMKNIKTYNIIPVVCIQVGILCQFMLKRYLFFIIILLNTGSMYNIKHQNTVFYACTKKLILINSVYRFYNIYVYILLKINFITLELKLLIKLLALSFLS